MANNSRNNDISLVERLKNADQRAACDLIDGYYKQIFRFMRRLGHDMTVSEDLTQQTFIDVWRHVYQLRNDGALKSWIYRIAANVSRAYYRKNKNAANIGVELAEQLIGQSSPLRSAQDSDGTRILYREIFALPEKLRQAVVIHYFQELTIAQSAQAVGVSQGTFKSRLNRALKKLGNAIPDQNGEGE